MSGESKQPKDYLTTFYRGEQFVEAFEKAWREGDKPRLEDFLPGPPLDRKVILLDLVRVDLKCRLRAGQGARAEDYLGRFPELHEDARAVRELLDFEQSQKNRYEGLVPTKEFGRPISGNGTEVGEQPSPPAESLPKMIGKYEVLSLLGEGSFARVFLAADKDTGRRVAIKVPKGLLFGAEIEAFLDEARILVQLEHEHIVPVYHVDRTDEQLPYLVSRYMEGGSLAQKLAALKKADQRLSFEESARLIAAIATALHSAHTPEKGKRDAIYHRDIKPGNIFLDGGGKPYLGDFGMALRETDFNMSRRWVGTPAYMSPEQASGKGGRVGGASDIYSLGVVLYELLTGQLPFRGGPQQDVQQLFAQIIEVPPLAPRAVDGTIPVPLEEICLRALAKQPDNRYRVAGDLADALSAYLDSARGVRPAGLPVTVAPFAKRPAGPLRDDLVFNDDLARGLPLPLAQLYRRAHNAKSAPELHNNGYLFWEVGIKLLAAVAIAEYAQKPGDDVKLAERLENLARPLLGHWLEFLQQLTSILADRGWGGFPATRDMLVRRRSDLPHAAGLSAFLAETLDGASRGRSQVQLMELLQQLVRYRSVELANGAAGQRETAQYERLGRALLAAAAEVFGRLDVLAGSRLVYLGDLWQSRGVWLVPRYELRGESPRRLPTLELNLPKGHGLPQGDRVYLQHDGTDEAAPVLCSLHPMVLHDPESGEVLFLNARPKQERLEYLCYTTGRRQERADLGSEQHALLTRVMGNPVAEEQEAKWVARSVAEEPAGGEVEQTGRRMLGEFELLSELGRGAMGIVYRAWQPSLGRQVGVKKLYRIGDPKAEARFAREIRALGQVEHPHLVKIFTSASDGEQWFYSMELVEGATLAAVCDGLHGPDTHPDTVDFQMWQEAVNSVCCKARKAEKALSSSSVFPAAAESYSVSGDVTAGDAEPKISASGKAGGFSPAAHASWPVIPSRRPGKSYVYQVVELVRQVAEAAHALHERSILHRDIKPGNIMVTADGNLAVLMDLGLAQIADEVEGRLTKTRQFIGTLRYASPEQVLAVGGLDRRSDIYSLGATLWELLTLRPMFQATEQTPTPELMRRIQVEEPERPRKYHPHLSRDLEAIVLKCLDKDARRRYQTALDLVHDLERYQRGEPVKARPVGTLQRCWRWCRRNPAWATMLATLVLVVLGSLAGLTSLYLEADQERQRAEQQRQAAEHKEAGARAINDFYEDHVLAVARPKGWDGGVGKDVTLKEALDQAVPKIDAAFPDQPELEAAVRDTLGMTYHYLGLFDAANPQLERAYQIRLEVLGPDDPDTLTSLHNLVMQRWKQGKIKEAVAMARDAWQRRQRVLGPDHEHTLWTQLWLGLVLEDDNQLDEAETVLRQAIAVCKRTLGPDHRYTLHGQNDLAIVLYWQGKAEEALALERQTLAGRLRSLGPDHPDTLRSMCNLAVSLADLGQLEEAEALSHKSLVGRRRVLGPEHIETLWGEWIVGDLLARRGNYAEGEKILRHSLEGCRRLLGSKHPDTLRALSYLGDLLCRAGRLSEAEPVLRECLIGREKNMPLGHWRTAHARAMLGHCLLAQGKFAEAEPLLLAGYERLQKGAPQARIAETLAWIIDLYEQSGRAEQAETWRKKRPEN